MTWGNNGTGELGDGTITQRNRPVVVNGLSGVMAIAAGNNHDLALSSNGTVMAWGRNDTGQLGGGTTTGPEICVEGIPCSGTPQPVKGLEGVKAISAGYNYNLALLNDGSVMAWGEDQWAQLGDGTNVESSDVPSSRHCNCNAPPGTQRALSVSDDAAIAPGLRALPQSSCRARRCRQ